MTLSYAVNAQKQSIDSLQRALVKAKSVKEEINLLAEIAEALVDHDPKEGIDYINKALKLAEQNGFTIEVANCKVILGSLSNVMKKFDDSQKHLSSALKIYETESSLYGQARVYFFLGFRERLQGNQREAIKHFEKALKISKRNGDQVLGILEKKHKQLLDGEIWKGLGNAYHFIGDFQKAANYYVKALEVYKAQGKKDKQLGIYANMSLINKDLGNIRLAFKYGKAGLQLAKETQNKKAENAILTNTAIIYERQGEYREALKLYKDALSSAIKAGNKELIPLGYQNIGNVNVRIGHYKDAYANFQKALKAAREVKNKHKETSILNNISALHYLTKDFDKALEGYEKLAIHYKKMGVLRGQGLALRGMGNVYLGQEKFDKALQKLQEAYKIFNELHYKEYQAKTANSLASVFIKLKDYAQANKYTQIALQKSTQLKAKRIVSRSYFNQHLINIGQKQFSEALDNYKRYKTIIDSLDKISKTRQLEVLRVHYKMDEKDEELSQKDKTIRALASKNNRSQQWISALGICLGVITIVMLWQSNVYRKKMKLVGVEHQFLQEQTKRKETEFKLVEEQLQKKEIEEQMLQEQLKQDQEHKKHLQENLEDRNHELTKQALYIVQKRELLCEIKTYVDEVVSQASERVKRNLRKVLKLIKGELGKNEEWENFTQTFEIAHPQFFTKLKASFPELTSHEIRLCALLRLNFSSKELALILNIAIDSVNKARFRLRKKLELTDENLNEYLMSL
ncbi:hypothetical protein BKI52_13850 [marine bacterium AO1-C]|nr:hypothetical protein BKI52_13850 [marine bacterium AO1-C]